MPPTRSRVVEILRICTGGVCLLRPLLLCRGEFPVAVSTKKKMDNDKFHELDIFMASCVCHHSMGKDTGGHYYGFVHMYLLSLQ